MPKIIALDAKTHIKLSNHSHGIPLLQALIGSGAEGVDITTLANRLWPAWWPKKGVKAVSNLAYNLNWRYLRKRGWQIVSRGASKTAYGRYHLERIPDAESPR